MKLIRFALSASLFASVSCLAVAQDLTPLRTAMQVKWPKNRSLQIVFHGHSVPAGYHKTPEVRTFESYPHLFHVWLKQRYPHAVINVIVTAIGGEDSLAGSVRFERDVLPYRPDLIFIDYALNDMLKPIADVEKSWRAMIELAKKSRIPVVLMTPTGEENADMKNPENPLRQRADLIRRLAKEESVLVADVSAAWLAEMEKGTPQAELLSQVNHPNLRGHQIALGAIVECLQLEPAKLEETNGSQ
mgnify:CR=1 FL=1